MAGFLDTDPVMTSPGKALLVVVAITHTTARSSKSQECGSRFFRRVISARAFFTPGWADLGSAARTLAVLWNQQRPSLTWGNTSRNAPQNLGAPSPTTAAHMSRRAQSLSRSAEDSADSQ